MAAKTIEGRSDRSRRKILVCYDDSAEAERALDRVAELAAAVPSRVTVVSVAESTGRFTSDADPSEAGAHNYLLEKAIWTLSDRGIGAATVEPTGTPAESIIDVAREIGADLVVVGSRHRGVVRRFLFGSVSAQVVAESPCDVLVVR